MIFTTLKEKYPDYQYVFFFLASSTGLNGHGMFESDTTAELCVPYLPYC
jgi:hypothetical protein